MARQCGVVQEHLLEEQELAHKLSILRQVVYKAPAMDALANFKSDIEEWLREPSITIKKVWLVLSLSGELRSDTAQYGATWTAQFPLGTSEVMVRITTTPRYVGKRIREEIARLPLNTYVTGEHHLLPEELLRTTITSG